MVRNVAVGELAADYVWVLGQDFKGRGCDIEVVRHAWVVIAIGACNQRSVSLGSR